MFASVIFENLRARTPSEGRKAFLSICSSAGPEFANRDSKGGNLQESSLIRFGFGPQNAVRLIGVRPEGVSLVMQILPKFIEEFERRKGEKLQFNVRSGPISWQKLPYLANYCVSSLIISNHLKLIENQEEREKLALKALEKGLRSYTDYLDLPELPADFVVGDFEEESFSQVEAGRIYRTGVSGTFRMNLSLSGPWMIGAMASKGCGHVRRITVTKGGK